MSLRADKCRCGGQSGVYDVRRYNKTITRRRRCQACGARWTTSELRSEEVPNKTRQRRRDQLIARIIQTTRELEKS